MDWTRVTEGQARDAFEGIRLTRWMAGPVDGEPDKYTWPLDELEALPQIGQVC